MKRKKRPALKPKWESLYHYDFDNASNDSLLKLRDKAYDVFYKVIPKRAERLLGDFEEIVVELERRSNQ